MGEQWQKVIIENKSERKNNSHIHQHKFFEKNLQQRMLGFVSGSSHNIQAVTRSCVHLVYENNAELWRKVSAKHGQNGGKPATMISERIQTLTKFTSHTFIKIPM